MRIASINLNKRSNSTRTRAALSAWLERRGVSVLVAQEPWQTAGPAASGFGEFIAIGGSGKVFSWIRRTLKTPAQVLVAPFLQRIELDYLVVYNVYLDAYRKESRAEQLGEMREHFVREGDRPMLVVGDFNLAPEERDGVVDGEHSTFNTEVDRGPLRRLTKDVRLLDLGCREKEREWTIERNIGGRKITFRCDLALASDYMAPEIALQVDHSVRLGEHGFTDHSALVLEAPVSPESEEGQLDLFTHINGGTRDADRVRPEKTAMHRSDPSPFARTIGERVDDLGVSSILDYGCGYGRDVVYYRGLGISADGYDPHAPFGWSVEPQGRYGLVTVLFVLNVLPNMWVRLETLRKAARFLDPGGRLLVVTRSEAEIEQQAVRGSWERHNDGYWSHEGRGTFQKGIGREEILRMAARLGMKESERREIAGSTASTCVFLEASG